MIYQAAFSSLHKTYVRHMGMLVLWLGLLLPCTLLAQGTNTDFGQNRVQHQALNWKYLADETFDAYYYGSSPRHAEFAMAIAHEFTARIEQIVGYRLSGRVQLVIFNSLSDYQQSKHDIHDPQFNSGGYSNIPQNRVYLYFDGNHIHFMNQIRSGLAEALVEEMIYGGSLQERIQNTFISFPPWFTRGLYSYLANPWDAYMDNRMRDAIINNKFKRFNDLSQEEAIFAGHSMWRFIADKYGRNAIANILYVSRVSRNYDNGFIFILGLDSREVLKEWKIYYTQLYEGDEENRFLPSNPEKINEKLSRIRHTQLRISSDGRYTAFVTNNYGRQEVWIWGGGRNSLTNVYRHGYKSFSRITDYDYPLIAWSERNQLALILPGKQWPVLRLVDLKGNTIKEMVLTEIEKVNSIDFSADGKRILMSAVKANQTDLYEIEVSRGTQKQLTQDIYDELDARWIDEEQRIVYTSNQPLNTPAGNAPASELYSGYTDLFMLEPNKPAVRFTQTAKVNEQLPMQYLPGYITYLSDSNGIVNSYALKLSGDTIGYAVPLTNYRRNIMFQDAAPEAAKIAELIFDGSRYQIFISDTDDDFSDPGGRLIPQPTRFRRSLTDTIAAPTRKTATPPRLRLLSSSPDTQQVLVPSVSDTATYFLQSEYETLVFDDAEKAMPQLAQDSLRNENRPGMKYRLQFAPDYVVAQIDNSMINTYYYPINADRKTFTSQWLNVLAKMSISDLMYRYNFTAGIRFMGQLNGSDAFFHFTDMRGRIDKTFSYMRTGRSYQNSQGYYDKFTINEGRITLKYPFSDHTALRLGGFYREDRMIALSSESSTLQKSDDMQQWLGYKAEVIFDNTISLGMDLYQGTRLKAFNELYQSVNYNGQNVFNLGIDARHYIKVHRTMVWANRFVANTSIGTRKVLYIIGGVENWINPGFNSLALANEGLNVFQSIATNLRGFNQNIRNGNSYMILNSELRVPVFMYFSAHPVRNEFFKNFLVVPFVDAGTAWAGPSPYSERNPFNHTVINTGSADITVITRKNPFVMGFGSGIRSKIFGYFIKYDIGWGVQDSKIGKPVQYVSLSLDF